MKEWWEFLDEVDRREPEHVAASVKELARRMGLAHEGDEFVQETLETLKGSTQ